GGNGGGVETAYSLVIEDSTLSGNKAAGSGGAMDCFPATSVTIRNSTISGNSANGGAGVEIGTFSSSSPFTVQIHKRTITRNSASGQGGGIEVGGPGTVTIESSILFGDGATSGSEIFRFGAVTVNTSLVQSKSGVTTFTGDAFTNSNIGQNPQLGPLADNGGP